LKSATKTTVESALARR